MLEQKTVKRLGFVIAEVIQWGLVFLGIIGVYLIIVKQPISGSLLIGADLFGTWWISWKLKQIDNG